MVDHATRHCGDGVAGSERRQAGQIDGDVITPKIAAVLDGIFQRGLDLAVKKVRVPEAHTVWWQPA